MKIPVIELELNKPTRSSLAWYGGIGIMATVGVVEWSSGRVVEWSSGRVVEWPLAAVIVAGHLISENSASPAVSGAAGGAESAAG